MWSWVHISQFFLEQYCMTEFWLNNCQNWISLSISLSPSTLSEQVYQRKWDIESVFLFHFSSPWGCHWGTLQLLCGRFLFFYLQSITSFLLVSLVLLRSRRKETEKTTEEHHAFFDKPDKMTFLPAFDPSLYKAQRIKVLYGVMFVCMEYGCIGVRAFACMLVGRCVLEWLCVRVNAHSQVMHLN